MKSIESEATSLHGLGLTLDLVLTGDRVEIDPEGKIVKKEKYVRYDFAMTIIEAYASDLLQAYRTIENLEEENDSIQDELEETRQAADTANGQLQQILQKNKDLEKAENLLATFEQQLDTLAKDKKMDRTTIDKLRKQVEQLEQLADEVPQLREDVNTVLENLRSYFEEEGIHIDDIDDDYGEDGYYEDDYQE